ncbi:hypothetical protein [Aquimarina sp. MAR_2010_214]|uniref:hypothetical protein n=1 Tax=Aquimarina sp. MAR_2010_214 TaxID=1250026 RepID=UPI00117842FB|nr:hypothetical protein [Aquimarina sp. MAR_2010_214]
MKSLSNRTIDSIKANGHDYYIISKGKGETIFLLHGFSDIASIWYSFLDPKNILLGSFFTARR